MLQTITNYFKTGSLEDGGARILDLNLERVYYDSSVGEQASRTSVLQHELNSLSKPFEASEMFERLEFLQKIEKVTTFNLNYELQKASPQLTEGVGQLLSTSEHLAQIKDDLTISRLNVAQLKQKMAFNTLQALDLLERRKRLEEVKRIVTGEVISLRNTYNSVFRLIDDFEFVQAI